MTKKELVKSLAEQQGITQTTATKFLDAVNSIIATELAAGNEVVLGPELGTFKPTTRTGIVPGTTRRYNSKSAKFSPSAALKRVLN